MNRSRKTRAEKRPKLFRFAKEEGVFKSEWKLRQKPKKIISVVIGEQRYILCPVELKVTILQMKKLYYYDYDYYYFGVWSGDSASESPLKGYSRNISIAQ